MKCPSCGREMSIKKEDVSYGGDKAYDRVQFICYDDDVWVCVETPQMSEEETA